MNELDDRRVDELLHSALSGLPEADFDHWRSRYSDAVAYLNPIVTISYQRRRRFIMRVTGGLAAATLIAAVVGLPPSNYARVNERIATGRSPERILSDEANQTFD
jgi:hypothetical protein